MPPVARARSWRALVADRRWPLVLLAVAILVAALVPPVVAARAADSADERARTAAAALDAAGRGVRVTTNSADDAAAQQAAASAALTGVLGDVEVVGTRLTYPLDAHTADDPADPVRAVILAHVADWADRVDLVDGRAPEPGTLEVVAPAASGVTTGEHLLVGSAGLPVEVVGTWQPRDPGDALWFADPGLATGTLSDRRGAVGPLFVADDAAVDRAADRPLVRWTVAPPLAGLGADELARLARGLQAVPDALAAAGAIVQGSTAETDGGPALAAIADRALADEHRARAAVAAGLGAGLLALLAAAGTLERRTRRERERLLARGAAPARLVRRESAGVVAAALAGGALGWAAGAVAGRGSATIATVAAAGGAVAALATGLRRLPVDASRHRGAAVAALVALLVVGTGLALWRLVRVSDEPDAAGQAAPMLLLVCAGLLAGLVARRAGNGRAGVHRAWLLPVVAALLGGATCYALRADEPALRAAWVAAAGGALAAGVVTVVADVLAGRPVAARAARERAAISLVVGLVVACGLGVGAALATAGLVVGGAS